MSPELLPDADRSVAETLIDRLRLATAGVYDIAGELGHGGMAHVFLADDLRLGRKVAIKVMSPELGMMPGMSERFLAEARTVAALQHPNIVVVHDVQRAKGLSFFVMALVNGVGVDQLVRAGTALPVDVARWILLCACEALSHAHHEGIVHRDVKPGNILVNTKGEVVLTDFGIAKVTSGESSTKSGTQIGTPLYMSPEQFTGDRPLGPAADQYALGVTAYQLLAGTTPFTGDMGVLIASHLTRQPEPLRQRNPEVPPFLANAIMRMLEKEPGDRWPSLEEFAGVLRVNMPRDGGEARRELARAVQHLVATRTGGSGPWNAVVPVSPAPESRPAIAPRAVTRVVTVWPPAATIYAGATIDLRASVTSESGEPVTELPVRWSSSDPAIAIVGDDGRVTGIAAGNAVLRATVEGGFAEARITVELAPIVRLAVSTPRLGLLVGDSAQAVVSAIDVTGAVRGDATLVFQSRAADVARVEAGGTIVALREGQAIVEVSSGGVRQSIEVTVARRPVARLRIVVADTRVELGARLRLGLEALDDRGLPTDPVGVQWASADAGVLHVDSTGTALAISEGTVRVGVRCDQATDVVTIEVVEAPVAALALHAAASDLEVGDETSLRLRVTDRSGGERSSRGIALVCDAPSVLALEENGRTLRALRPGRATIRATWTDDTAPPVETTLSFVVHAPTIARLDITPASLDLEAGTTATLVVRAYDRRGRAVDDARCTWESLSPEQVSVVEPGVVRGDSVGMGMVRVTAANARGPAAESRVAVLVRPKIVPEPTPTAGPAAVSAALAAIAPPPVPEPVVTTATHAPAEPPGPAAPADAPAGGPMLRLDALVSPSADLDDVQATLMGARPTPSSASVVPQALSMAPTAKAPLASDPSPSDVVASLGATMPLAPQGAPAGTAPAAPPAPPIVSAVAHDAAPPAPTRDEGPRKARRGRGTHETPPATADVTGPGLGAMARGLSAPAPDLAPPSPQALFPDGATLIDGGRVPAHARLTKRTTAVAAPAVVTPVATNAVADPAPAAPALASASVSVDAAPSNASPRGGMPKAALALGAALLVAGGAYVVLGRGGDVPPSTPPDTTVPSSPVVSRSSVAGGGPVTDPVAPIGPTSLGAGPAASDGVANTVTALGDARAIAQRSDTAAAGTPRPARIAAVAPPAVPTRTTVDADADQPARVAPAAVTSIAASPPPNTPEAAKVSSTPVVSVQDEAARRASDARRSLAITSQEFDAQLSQAANNLARFRSQFPDFFNNGDAHQLRLTRGAYDAGDEDDGLTRSAKVDVAVSRADAVGRPERRVVTVTVTVTRTDGGGTSTRLAFGPLRKP